MSWEQARAALDSRFCTLAGLDRTKIAWPGYVYDPSKQTPPNGPYWKIDLLPAGVDPELNGKDHEHGIYQVSRFVPSGQGIAQALKDCQTVIDLFKRQILSGVSCRVPTLAPYITEADWLHFPISIPFQVL